MKDLLIRKLPHGQLYEVYMKGGGVIPDELSGVYTKIRFIENAINTYVTKRDKPKREYRKSKVKTDGKSTSKS